MKGSRITRKSTTQLNNYLAASKAPNRDNHGYEYVTFTRSVLRYYMYDVESTKLKEAELSFDICARKRVAQLERYEDSTLIARRY